MSSLVTKPSQARMPVPKRMPFKHDVLSRIGLIILISFLIVAIAGPFLPIGDPEAIGVGPRLASPSADWIAGTDSLGRSMLPRLAQGVRTTFVLAGLAVAVMSCIGVLLGIVAAYFRGPLGEVIVRCADVLFVFPAIILALLIAAIVGPGEKGAIMVIVIVSIPMMVRVVYAASLGVVSRDFVVAARVGGARAPRIMLIHVLPSVAGTAVVQATFALSAGMLIESSLSFLGLGVQPPRASLGSLVNEGAVYLPIAPWLVLIPGVLLALAIMAVNLVGDGLRDLLDVRAAEMRR